MSETNELIIIKKFNFELSNKALSKETIEIDCNKPLGKEKQKDGTFKDVSVYDKTFINFSDKLKLKELRFINGNADKIRLGTAHKLGRKIKLVVNKDEYFWIPSKATLIKEKVGDNVFAFQEKLPVYPDENYKKAEGTAALKKTMNILLKAPKEKGLKVEVDATGKEFMNIGDLHGRLNDAIFNCKMARGILKKGGKVVFNGDYIDKGAENIEVLEEVFKLKAEYPNDVTLLRGNHESPEANSQYRFKPACLLESCQKKFFCMADKAFLAINRIFETKLAYCAIVKKGKNKIFCAHGGMPQADLWEELMDEEKNKIPDKTEMVISEENSDGSVTEYVIDDYGNKVGILDREKKEITSLTDKGKKTKWKPPEEEKNLIKMLTTTDPSNALKKGYNADGRPTVGKQQIDEFCKVFGINVISRSHQAADEQAPDVGADEYGGRLITTFSSSGYTKNDKRASTSIFGADDSKSLTHSKIVYTDDDTKKIAEKVKEGKNEDIDEKWLEENCSSIQKLKKSDIPDIEPMKISKELRIKAEKMLEGPIAKAVAILGDKMSVELFKKNNELDHIRKHVSLCKTFLKSSK